MQQRWTVMYTRDKVKKRKTWHDGSLSLTGNKAALCDEAGATLETRFLRPADL